MFVIIIKKKHRYVHLRGIFHENIYILYHFLFLWSVLQWTLGAETFGPWAKLGKICTYRTSDFYCSNVAFILEISELAMSPQTLRWNPFHIFFLVPKEQIDTNNITRLVEKENQRSNQLVSQRKPKIKKKF